MTHVLLVDDNDDDAELTLRALAKHGRGATTVRARDGVEALELLFGSADRPPLRPQLVLLDLHMPRVDGAGVLREMRGDARTALVPVVVLTSSAEERDVLESYRLGANGYVRKPVDFVEFTEAVRTLGAYWLALNLQPAP
jgi:CheY-like chemotaxis protein